MDDIEPTIKNLSQDEALYEYDQLFSREMRNIVNAYTNLGKLLDLLEQAGYARTDAINKISKDASDAGLKGFSQRSIYRMLPEEIKKETGRPQSLPNGKLSNIREAPSQVQLGKKKVTLPGRVVEMYEHTSEAETAIADFNQQVREQVTQPRRHEEAFMPLPLAEQLNKFLLARMIGMARSNGDTSIRFKINNEGELYVP